MEADFYARQGGFSQESWRISRKINATLAEKGAARRRFDIFQTRPNLYGALHEADLCKAVAAFDEIERSKVKTNLAKRRISQKISQSQLAQATGISKRSIQLYEKRKMISTMPGTIAFKC